MSETTQPVGQTPPPFTFKTVGELYETRDEQVSFCVENLLPSGGLSVLAGKPKAGKSTLARQLAVVVAQGLPFLGRVTEKGTVLYLALEEKLSEVKNHFKDLGLAESDPVRVHCAPAPTNALAMLEATLKAMTDVRLVIIDPIFKFIKVSDSNDYVKVNDAFDPLLTLARKYGVHIMAVHHMKKRVTEDPMDGNLGSTAIAAAVDTYLALQTKPNGLRTLCSRQRYGTDLSETQVEFDAEARTLSLGLTSDEAEATRKRQTTERIRTEIIQYVTEHSESTQQAILEAVRGNTAVKKQGFRWLVDSGLLIESGGGARGDPYTYSIVSVPVEV